MKNNRQKTAIIFVALFILVSMVSVGFAENSNAKLLSETVQTGDEKFDKIFREGRELIDKEDWKQAAEKFKSIVCDCPEKKYVDAAFYWLAFTYKKQKMYAEMNDALDRLQKNFPNSSWSDDARVMKIEQNNVAATYFSNGNFIYNATDTFGVEFVVLPEKTPLDREEEIKLAAFRSLFATDANRAVALSDDLLKPASKAGENLKIQVIRSLSLQGSPLRLSLFKSPAQIATGSFSTSTNDNFAVAPASGRAVSIVNGSGQNTDSADNNYSTKIIPQIRDVFIKNFKADSNVKIKKELILGLGRLNDSESSNYFSQLYNSESDKELKKAILQALGGSSYSFGFSTTSAKTSDLRKSAVNKLLEIVRNEQDTELKTVALNSLQSTFSWAKAEEKTEFVQSLLQVYDSSDNESFKLFVIRSLDNLRQEIAVKKLMDIAKNDESDKLRIAAINALQGSKNPEVVKFLEDLIK